MSKTRPATPTVGFIDQYCAPYRSLFHNVRHFEPFTALHLGLLAETRRKSLPRLGQTVHLDSQALHHFLANAEWSVGAMRTKRLDLLRQAIGQTPFIRCIDETGDRKKGHTTDSVATQYIGNLHTLANGIVSVNAYGVLGATPFPLLFRSFKPESRLKAGDVAKSKPQLAIELVEDLLALGFRFRVVLADSLYGESGEFIGMLHRHHLEYVVAIRSNHGVADAAGPAHPPDPLAPLRPRLHRWQSRAALHPRDHLRHASSRALLPNHHRPPDPAARDHLGPHDQSSGQDRSHRRQHVRLADVD
jgi:SRSO17 transposase